MVKIRLGSTLLFFLCLLIASNIAAAAQSNSAAPADQIKPGAITGKIMINGGAPLAGGRVLFYDASLGPVSLKGGVRRVPDLKVDIYADGKFWAELPPGKYYMKAVKKLSSGHGLQDGDYNFFSLDDDGNPKEYVVKSGTFLDIGVISGAVTRKKVDGTVKTAIEGVIIDTDGKPVEGAIVFAFMDQTTSKRPLFASQETGGDGKFILAVPEGTYYLKVRNRVGGGPPEPGDIVGIFGEQTPTGIKIKEGEIMDGVNIKVVRFRGRGPAPGAGPKQK